MDLLNPRIPVGNWAEDILDWMTTNLAWLFDFIKTVLTGFYDGLYFVLGKPVYLIIIVVFAALGWWISGWKLALFTLIGFYLIRAFDQWDNAMSTIALMLVAVVLALVIAIPLGIWAAR